MVSPDILHQLMNTGLDNWVVNCDVFFNQAREYTQLGRRRESLQTDPDPDCDIDLLGAEDFARPPNVTLPVTQVNSVTPHSPAEPTNEVDDARHREAGILRRIQRRHNGVLTPEVLINLELAAYYLLLLINVSPII